MDFVTTYGPTQWRINLSIVPFFFEGCIARLGCLLLASALGGGHGDGLLLFPPAASLHSGLSGVALGPLRDVHTRG